MRLSADDQDPAYLEYALMQMRQQRPRVFLDGVEVQECITADTETGYVLRYRRDAEGKHMLNEARDDTIREELHGVVTITAEDVK